MVLLLFSPIIIGAVPITEETPQFDRRCYPAIQYARKVLEAREQGITKDELQNDLLEAEMNRQLDKYTPKAIGDMWYIIEMLYENDVSIDDQVGINNALNKINGWCTQQLPPADIEERRWYDEDGDGFPDYDENGERIQKIIV